MEAIDRFANKLIKDRTSLENNEGEMSALLKPDFDATVQYMLGDGYMVLDYEKMMVASLSQCIEIVKECGVLSREDHNSISI